MRVSEWVSEWVSAKNVDIKRRHNVNELKQSYFSDIIWNYYNNLKLYLSVYYAMHEKSVINQVSSFEY